MNRQSFRVEWTESLTHFEKSFGIFGPCVCMDEEDYYPIMLVVKTSTTQTNCRNCRDVTIFFFF
jgi:hypothetical protein